MNKGKASGARPGRTAGGGAAVALALLALAGCSVVPQALTPDEQFVKAQEELSAIIGRGEAVTAPLSLHEAAARAIRHNLEFRVRQMELVVQTQQLDLSRFDMLPRLALQAGYSWRSNDAFGLGYQPDGTISSVPSSAVERERTTGNANLTWNVLDFGLSYYRARQNADQVLVVEERRRRALQNLVLDVQLGWWRAEAAQRLLPEIDAMLTQIDRATERSRLIEARRLLPPLQIIAYRRSLLDLQQQLSARRQELVQWRAEFAELVGLRPGEPYRVLSTGVGGAPLPDLVTRADALEALALQQRPELAEERYRERITHAEGRRQLLSLLPSLNLNLGRNYDGNRFLLNNQWTEAANLIGFNLFKLLSLPAMKRSQAAAEELDRARREAVAMAVMAQTRVAVNRYDLLRHEYGVWNQALLDDRALLKAMQVTREAGLETELELIRAGARLAITEINRDIVHANLEHAMGRVMNSVGYDVVTAGTDASSTPSLAAQLQAALGVFAQDNFTTAAGAVMKPASIASVRGVPPQALAPFTEAMQTVLRVAQIPTVDSGGAVQAEVVVQLGPQQESGRPVTLDVRLLDGPSGNTLHTAQMKSMLVEPVSPDQWRVLGEAAVFRVAENLRRLLGGGPALPRDALQMTEGGALKIDSNWSGPRALPASPR